MEGCGELSGVPVVSGPEQSASEKWRYWRCGLVDGTRITVNVGLKAPGKSGLGINHEKLASPEEVERWRALWKDTLEAL